jgi:hypothetical protein
MTDGEFLHIYIYKEEAWVKWVDIGCRQYYSISNIIYVMKLMKMTHA